MAVERAARWATPASLSSISAALDEQADLGVAHPGFSELQSLEQQQQFTEVYAYLARLLNQTLNSKFTPDAPAPLDPTKQDEQIKLVRI